MSLLNLATIKIDLVMKGNFLAKVTLNWNGEFEVRFFRITLRGDGTVWFQPPALKEHGWAKCFGVIDTNNWKWLEERVKDEFFRVVEEKINEGVYTPSLLEKLKNAELKKDILTEEDFNNIDKEIT